MYLRGDIQNFLQKDLPEILRKISQEFFRGLFLTFALKIRSKCSQKSFGNHTSISDENSSGSSSSTHSPSSINISQKLHPRASISFYWNIQEIFRKRLLECVRKILRNHSLKFLRNLIQEFLQKFSFAVVLRFFPEMPEGPQESYRYS